MRVKIVGGGIAGLSSALFVSKAASKGSRIVVHMKQQSKANNVDYSFTGLWTPSLVCLESLGLLDQLLACGKCVDKSGYSSKSGTWLAVPNKGLYSVTRKDKSALSGSAPSPALLFVKTRDLVSVLMEAAQRDDKIVLLHDDEWSSAEDSQQGDCDLLIAADGMNSAVKRHFHQTEASSSHSVCYKNYDVYRGNVIHVVKDKDLLPEQSAFQTWGPGGKRFACVPTHEGYSWFAALSNKHAPLDQVEAKASFSLGDLRREFEGYHAPIDLLLQSTHPDSFSFTPAFASRSASYSPLSTILPNSNGQAVVYVGDAALCLDPILAQGAGCAIEDGRLLHDAIRHAEQGKMNDTSSGGKVKGEVGVSRDVLTYFEKSRTTRREKLLILSQIATNFGNISSPLLCSVRNALFAIAPSKVKGRVMDAAIAIGIESNVFEKE